MFVRENNCSETNNCKELRNALRSYAFIAIFKHRPAHERAFHGLDAASQTQLAAKSYNLTQTHGENSLLYRPIQYFAP